MDVPGQRSSLEPPHTPPSDERLRTPEPDEIETFVTYALQSTDEVILKVLSYQDPTQAAVKAHKNALPVDVSPVVHREGSTLFVGSDKGSKLLVSSIQASSKKLEKFERWVFEKVKALEENAKRQKEVVMGLEDGKKALEEKVKVLEEDAKRQEVVVMGLEDFKKGSEENVKALEGKLMGLEDEAKGLKDCNKGLEEKVDELEGKVKRSQEKVKASAVEIEDLQRKVKSQQGEIGRLMEAHHRAVESQRPILNAAIVKLLADELSDEKRKHLTGVKGKKGASDAKKSGASRESEPFSASVEIVRRNERQRSVPVPKAS